MAGSNSDADAEEEPADEVSDTADPPIAPDDEDVEDDENVEDDEDDEDVEDIAGAGSSVRRYFCMAALIFSIWMSLTNVLL